MLTDGMSNVFPMIGSPRGPGGRGSLLLRLIILIASPMTRTESESLKSPDIIDISNGRIKGLTKTRDLWKEGRTRDSSSSTIVIIGPNGAFSFWRWSRNGAKTGIQASMWACSRRLVYVRAGTTNRLKLTPPWQGGSKLDLEFVYVST